MLTNIENRLEDLFEQIEVMPPDRVEMAEKVSQGEYLQLTDLWYLGASVSKRVFVQILSYENKFNLMKMRLSTGGTYFHMNGAAQRLVLKPRQKAIVHAY